MDDRALRQDVIDSLEFDSSLEAQCIGVAVDDGVVTLSGHVGSYAEKIAAERACQLVRGVKAIAEGIEVRFDSDRKTADDQVAHRAVSIIAWDTQIPKDSVRVKVENGVVKLSGEVDWYHQRAAAEAAVCKLSGVAAVVNAIVLAPCPDSVDVKAKIMSALDRSAALDAASIRVSVVNDVVRLDGVVHGWHERRLAERAAWSAAGVKDVDDRLTFAAS